MNRLAFAASADYTLGVELELQIVNRHDYDLAPGAADLLRVLRKDGLIADVKPEITSSMIELSTGICQSHGEVLAQLSAARDALVRAAERQNLRLCGGGTHAFQDWGSRRIYDTPRFRQVSELYGYLSKQFTVFGQHVHIGCADADRALWLLHALGRFVPQLIALSADSPFVQGIDTGFHSARLNAINAFPLSGRAPWLLTWAEFEAYFDKMRLAGVVESMKDLYWDIRPKPEFGTVEIRVMDTPLSVERAAALAGFLQCLARWLLEEQPFQPREDDYLVYTFNRFQASRFGFEAELIDPATAARSSARETIAATVDRLWPYARTLEAEPALQYIADCTSNGTSTEADWLRAQQQSERYLPEVLRRQCLRFESAEAAPRNRML